MSKIFADTTIAESPEAAEKKRQKDAEYAKQGDKYKEQKENLKNTLYGDFEKKEKISEKPKSENPDFPIIERFSQLKWVKIESEEMNTIIEALGGKGEKQKENNGYESIKKVINSIEFKDKGVKKYFQNYLNQINQLNKGNKSKENEKSGKNENIIKDFKKNEYLKGFIEKNPDSELIGLLEKNYTIIPDGEKGEGNIEKDLQTSFDITVNKIIYNKSFPRNDIFEIALKDIKNGSMEEKIKALNYIFNLVNTNEGEKGQKDKLSIKKKTEKLTYDYKKDKIEELKKQLKVETDSKKKEEIEKQIKQLEKQNNKEGEFHGPTRLAGSKDHVDDSGKDKLESKPNPEQLAS